jgi:hypothetical protein
MTFGDTVFEWFLICQPTTLASPDAMVPFPADDASNFYPLSVHHEHY